MNLRRCNLQVKVEWIKVHKDTLVVKEAQKNFLRKMIDYLKMSSTDRLTHVIERLMMEGFNLAVPAYKEETEKNNYGDGEKYCTVENMLMRSKSTNQLK